MSDSSARRLHTVAGTATAARATIAQRYRATFEQSAVGISHTSAQGRFVEVNQKFCDIVGYPREELLSLGFADVTHPEDRQASVETLKALLSLPAGHQSADREWEKRYLRKDGSTVWASICTSLVRGRSGEPEYLVTVVQDITRRKRMEVALRESQALFEQFANSLPEAVWIRAVEGEAVLYVNHAWQEITGQVLVVGDSILKVLDVVHPDDRERVKAERANLPLGGLGHEFRVVRPDGAIRLVRMRTLPIRDGAGAVFRVAGILEDITAEHRARQILAVEHAVTRCLAGSTDVRAGLTEVLQRVCEAHDWEYGRHWTLDGKSNLMRPLAAWSKPGAGLEKFLEETADLSFAMDDGIGGLAWRTRQPVWTSSIPDDPRILRRELLGEAGLRGACVCPVSSEGRIIGMLAFGGRAVREPDARLLEAMPVISDQVGQFLKRKAGEDALRSSEQRFRSLIENNSDAIAVFDAMGNIHYGSPATVRILGYDRGSLGGKSIFELVHPDDLRALREPLARLLSTPGAREEMQARMRHKDGSWRTLNGVFTNLTADEAVRNIVVNYRDITESKRQEEYLRQFRATMEMSADLILLVDRSTMRYIDVNARASERLGYTREELLALGPQDIGASTRDEFQRTFDALIGGDTSVETYETVLRRKDGTRFPVEIARRAVASGAGHVIVSSMRDITARKTAEAAADRQALQHRLIAAFGHLALATTDVDDLAAKAVETICEGLGVGFCKVLQVGADGRTQILRAGAGWSDGWIGQRIADVSEDTQNHFVLSSGTPVVVDDFATEKRFKPSGILAAHHIASGVEVPIAGSQGPYGLLGAFSREAGHFAPRDVHFLQSVANTLETALERRRAEERAAHLAQFDSLTGLPNRNLFIDRLAQAISQAERNAWQGAVLFVDLDHFKKVNDTLGHGLGDELLREVASRLEASVRSGDTVARLGGDEYAIVLANLARPDDAAIVAKKVVAACDQAFDIGNGHVHVSASAGIALFPADGTDAIALLKSADIAMYRAKDQGRARYQFYVPEMHERALARVRTETQLRSALEHEEFVLHYQPKADLRSGAICGFEALLRWQHPDRGLVVPAEFIPILEDTGLIVPVGEWVLRTVCAQIKRWRAQGKTPLPVAVNLSARQFQQKELDKTIGAILRQTATAPTLLELELTESLLMKDPEHATRVLNNLKNYGLSLSVDDFGTGYSSLAYLKRFPLDALKIDRAFIRDCITDPEDAMIARAVINLAHSLKLKVVAEGVETLTQLEFLRAHGCDVLQGYYFSRPLTADATTSVLDGSLALPGHAGEDEQPAILVVDDNADDLQFFTEAIAGDGQQILVARDAKSALAVLAEHRVAVLVSDHKMPGMSGVKFLAAVRNLYPDVIRVLLTGSESATTLPAAVNEAGIHKFISKHWPEARLHSEVREAFRMSLQDGASHVA